jgi:hypothetical protein
VIDEVCADITDECKRMDRIQDERCHVSHRGPGHLP